jgi:hypothetical protein
VTLHSCFHASVVVSPPAKAVWLGMFPAACLLPTLPGNSQSANPTLLPSAPRQIWICWRRKRRPTVTSSGAESPQLPMAQAEEMALKNNHRVSVGRIFSFYS